LRHTDGGVLLATGVEVAGVITIPPFMPDSISTLYRKSKGHDINIAEAVAGEK